MLGRTRSLFKAIPPKGSALKIAGAALVGAVATVTLVIVLRTVMPAEAQSPSASGSTQSAAGSGNSTGQSTNQRGGQTGGTIINKAPVYNGTVNQTVAPAPASPPHSSQNKQTVNGGCNILGNNNKDNTLNCQSNFIQVPSDYSSLSPANDKTPDNDCGIPEGAVAVFVGSIISWRNEQSGEHTIFSMGGLPILTIFSVRNQIDITTLRLFDDRNDIIVRDDNGSIWVNPTVRIKKPDKSTLVVYDHNDDEVLNLRFLNPGALSVQGKFYRRNAPPLVINNGADQSGSNMIGHMCLGDSYGPDIAL